MSINSADRIIITDLLLYVNIGTTQRERRLPQRILASASIGLDAALSARTGRIEDTVCYAALASKFRTIAGSREYVLLEELAEALAEAALNAGELVQQVVILLKKFAVPDTAWVGVEITRRKNADSS